MKIQLQISGSHVRTCEPGKKLNKLEQSETVAPELERHKGKCRESQPSRQKPLQEPQPG